MASSKNLLDCLTKQNPFMKRFSSQVQKQEKPTQQSVARATSDTPKDMTKVSAFRKRMFVMAGLYKNVEACPDTMSFSSLSRNMDRFRVRASIVLMIVGACGSLTSIFLAKGVVQDFEESQNKSK